MEKTKKTLNQVTAGDISVIFEKFKDEGLIYRGDLSKISKHLLKEFLSVNPFSVDFNTLTSSFLKHIEFDMEQEREEEKIFRDFRRKQKEELLKATENEPEFHRYICKRYFDLIKDPKDELLSAYEKAIADLKEIDQTLEDIKSELEIITLKNDAHEIQEKKPILYYYQKHNEEARTSILNFIKNDIREYALSKCYGNSIWGSLMARIPYNYSWNPDSYKPCYPNDLANKLGKLEYPTFVDKYELYNEDKPNFYKFLTQYIADEEIVVSLNNLVQQHHILDARKEILYETLDIYQNGSKIMFATAVPSIIEGIFHDLCILVGEKENDLLREGFQHKLDKLHDFLGVELHYEYYSFRFRLFRNKVSHGRLTKNDVDELADLLLLDLYQVCTLVQSDKLDLNHKRFVIDELNKKPDEPDYKYLMQYILLNKVEMPAFYNLDKQIDQVEKMIKSEEFWTFLDEEIAHGGEALKHGVHIVVKSISDTKQEPERCKAIFKKLGLKKSDKDVAKNYLRYLTRDY